MNDRDINPMDPKHNSLTIRIKNIRNTYNIIYINLEYISVSLSILEHL